jgi:hypothetical protein
MIIPFALVSWIVVGLAALLVSAVLLRNYIPYFKGKVLQGAVIISCAVALNIVLALTFQFYFFHYSSPEVSSSSNKSSNSSGASSNEKPSNGTRWDTFVRMN